MSRAVAIRGVEGGPSVGDFMGGWRSDLGKTSYALGTLAGHGLAIGGFSEGYAPTSPGSVEGGVAFGSFTFAEATIGIVSLFALLWWFSARGLKG